jgi:Zn-dependent peptidase ImmA (M78 family)
VFSGFEAFADSVAGFCDFRAKRTYVNAADPTNRQTFTIAHELGHWVLHLEYYLAHPERYPVLPRYGRPENSDPLEREANFFAAHLLVPDRLLRPVIGAPITSLASAFAVSREMMEHRVKNAK